MGTDVWHEQDGRCFWCGERRATCSDPVVPEGWFAAPPPTPITVPSCDPCSSSHIETNPPVPRIVHRQGVASDTLPGDPSTRTLSRRQARGLPKDAVASLRAVAAEIEAHRFERVMRNIVRGLYYHHFGERLGDDIPVRVVALEFLQVDELALWRAARGQSRLGSAVRYAFDRFAENPDASIWLIDLYGGASFVGMSDLEELASATGVVRGEPLAS